MSLNHKRVLITGGSGFIGTNLQRKLKEQGAYFEVFDKSLGHDIENKKQFATFIKKKFDVIFHLAGTSGSVTSNLDSGASFRINTFATVSLCELIIKHSPKTKLIISSSRLEYGKPFYLPVDEDHPTTPTTTYGLSKLLATQMAIVYQKHQGINVTILRTSNVYGPHKTKRFAGYNVINYFVDLALKNKELTIYGDGEQMRDYIYINDFIDAFILASVWDKSRGQIYNLGAGVGIKFKDMARLIVKKVGRGKIKFVKWPEDFKSIETGDYVSDISKIKKELGFTPKFNFEKGIQETLKLEI